MIRFIQLVLLFFGDTPYSNVLLFLDDTLFFNADFLSMIHYSSLFPSGLMIQFFNLLNRSCIMFL